MTALYGKTLLIANPAAQNGNGAKAAVYAESALRAALPEGSVELVLTDSSGHAHDLAAQNQGISTIIALGGDGLIHEIANGLMQIAVDKRPQLGVLPVGTGNDYARTLGMDFKIERSVEQLLYSTAHPFDIGCCNGEYFVETLSFGLDAAIALDTMDRRKRTGKTGTRVFVESGIDVVLHQRRSFRFTLTLDGEERPQDEALIVAVQVGPTYGGGFAICPDARTDDDLLDICIAHPPMGALRAVMIFLLAKNAHHTKFKQFDFARAKTLCFEFEEHPPTQIDGEPLEGTKFEIESIPAALQVLTP